MTESERAAYAASGRDEARRWIRPDWDTDILERFAQPDGGGICDLDAATYAAAGVGAHEVRTWVAAWAAGGRRPLQTVAYEPVPAWITGMAVATTLAEMSECSESRGSRESR